MTQLEALKILKTGANVFLTGEPGSGKTYVVNEYMRYLNQAKVEVAVTASTGIAATHLGGMTIHSWSGIGINKFITRWDMDRITSNQRIYERVRRTKVLVIDEISMLDGKILECVNQVCREIKQIAEPFGGIQTVFVGDFFQLPPVTRETEAPEFAFTSKIWREMNLVISYLSEQHRQEDKIFLEILSALRRNTISEIHCSFLEKRSIGGSESLSQNITKLFTHNEDVDRINSSELERIPGKTYVFEMTCAGRKSLIEQLKKGCLSPEKLLLKKGASVMFTKNSTKGSFVNGTLGTVVDFENHTNYPIVKTKRGKNILAESMDWTIDEHGKILGKISQIPLAWAMTVHKSQGMSLDAAFVDLRNSFVEGQGYVALSRVRTLSGLYLSGWNHTALKVHPQVLARDKEFRELSFHAREAFGKISHEELVTIHDNFIKACGGKIFEPISKSDFSVEIHSDGRTHLLEKAYSVEKIREKYPNAYKSWSEDEDGMLSEYYRSGKKVKEISECLGRKKGAISSRLKKLGLISA